MNRIAKACPALLLGVERLGRVSGVEMTHVPFAGDATVQSRLIEEFGVLAQ